MSYYAIALIHTENGGTMPYNTRINGFKKKETAIKHLNRWCDKNNAKFGYVQEYGKTKPVYVKGV